MTSFIENRSEFSGVYPTLFKSSLPHDRICRVVTSLDPPPQSETTKVIHLYRLKCRFDRTLCPVKCWSFLPFVCNSWVSLVIPDTLKFDKRRNKRLTITEVSLLIFERITLVPLLGTFYPLRLEIYSLNNVTRRIVKIS